MKIINNIAKIKNRDDIIKLLKIIKEYDITTYHHCINVARYVNNYCKVCNFDNKYTSNLTYGALLHDIGKIFIDKNILYKTGKLTEEEFLQICKHTVKGYRFLKENGIEQDIYMYALYHHYRIDNKNDKYDFSQDVDKEDLLINRKNFKYLYGICLLNVCDSYDAMISQRSYNKAKSCEEALEEIQSCIGTQFERKIATKFIEYTQQKIIQLAL